MSMGAVGLENSMKLIMNEHGPGGSGGPGEPGGPGGPGEFNEINHERACTRM